MRRTITRGVVAGAIVGLLAGAPAEAAQVSGIIRTAEGAPVTNARVTLVAPDTSVVGEMRSDGTGAYSFASVPARAWRVGTSARGRAYAEVLRNVVEGDVIQDFALGLDTHPGRWTTIGNTDPENLYASNSGSLLPDGTIFYCHDTLEPVLFNPVTGTKTFPPASPSQQGCHIPTLLADGRLLFIGGQDSGNFRDAVRTAKTYDYRTATWTELPDMYEERWYPGLARLADGRLLVMGGGQRPNAQRTATCEIFDPAGTTWTRTGSMANAAEYTPSVLLYNGAVLRTWWPPQLYDVATAIWRNTGRMVQDERFYPGHSDHSLVLLPDGRACAVGIYRGAAANPSMIELYDPATETWTLGANAGTTRSQPEVVMLPTGQMLVAGGKLEDAAGHIPTNAAGQTKLTDIYDPLANSWRRCADMAWYREYHAVTVLVPDGRVVTTAGTGGPAEPGVSNDIEAFEPPYLFRGVRPRIDSLSATTLRNGASFTLHVSRTAALTQVVLVGANAVTHYVDGGVPRVQSLPFQQANGAITVTVPVSRDSVPVGYYVLFALVDDIPSPGIVVRNAGAATGVEFDGHPPRLTLNVAPNPSDRDVRLSWFQRHPGPLALAVYSTRGDLVHRRTLASQSAGWHVAAWDGRDTRGFRTRAGVYWVTVTSGAETARTKLIRVP